MTIDSELKQRLEDLVKGAKRACHIKLGKGNNLAGDCINSSRIYIGYHTGPRVLELLIAEDPWPKIREFIKEKDKGRSAQASLTAAENQMRSVLDDDGLTLWFTFHETKLYWTFIDASQPAGIWEDEKGIGAGGQRRSLPWQCTNLKGEAKDLHAASVTTRISQVQGYQRTVRVYENQEDGDGFNPVRYLQNLILGNRQPETATADKAFEDLLKSCEPLIQRLTDKEFENFVDLLFVADGWIRETEVGGRMKWIDGEYVHATTGLRAKVQVKSSVSAETIFQAELNHAAAPGVLVYWAYHTADGDVAGTLANKWGNPRDYGGIKRFQVGDHSAEKQVVVLGCEDLARLAMRRGLVDWLIRKTS